MRTITGRLLAIALILGTTLGASASAPRTVPLVSPALKHLMISAWGDPINPEHHCFENIYTSPEYKETASLTLPEGSIVKYIALYYHHHDPGPAEIKLDLYSHLQAPPAAPVSTKLAGVKSSDTLQFGVVTSGELTIPIDMTSQGYDLVVTMPQQTGGFCAIRVDYIPPSIFGVALPTVLKNHP